MDSDEEMIVVIVEGDSAKTPKKNKNFPVPFEIKAEPLDESELYDMIETAKKYGERVDVVKNEVEVKHELEEAEDTYVDSIKLEYLDEDSVHFEDNLNFEENENFDENYSGDKDYVPEYSDGSDDSDNEKEEGTEKLRRVSVPPSQRKSFVKELRQQYPELRKNAKALVKTLSEIMRNVRRPEPPKDYFIMNDILFECRKCGSMSETIQAAGRHYQEKHGKRYLVCYACGVDFRSTTNLYKHEKRCVAPDAVVVLKARALCLGRKGRSRPFIPHPKDCFVRKPIAKRFSCPICPAEFSTKKHVESHVNMHKGLRPYRCTECSAAYTCKPKLRRHMKKHSDEEYICDHCNRPFKEKAAMAIHMNTHMPERKFPCGSCHRRYATKHALKNHVRRVHLQLPPPCACPICPAGYPRMSLVRDHMMRKHGMSLMTRTMFFKALPTMSDEKLKETMEMMKASETLLFPVQDTSEVVTIRKSVKPDP